MISAVGREGVDWYNKLGYVPYDVGINENAARTLEYATADFSISQFAKALGKTGDAAHYARTGAELPQALRSAKRLDARAQPGWLVGGAVQSATNGAMPLPRAMRCTTAGR